MGRLKLLLTTIGNGEKETKQYKDTFRSQANCQNVNPEFIPHCLIITVRNTSSVAAQQPRLGLVNVALDLAGPKDFMTGKTEATFSVGWSHSQVSLPCIWRQGQGEE